MTESLEVQQVACSPEGTPLEFQIGSHGFRLGAIGPEHRREVLTLFAEVFGHAVDERWYQWKYVQVPSRAIGLWDEQGVLVAHYAASPRLLLWQGEGVPSLQIGDVMVAPRVRGLLTRRGPFFRVCSLFYETWVGPTKPYKVAFGFPNERHIVLGQKLDLYHEAQKVHLLRWKTFDKPLSWQWRWIELRADEPRFDRDVAAVWRRMAADLHDCVLGERSPDYLRWRFLKRPDRNYRLFCLRHWWGQPAAVVIMHFTENAVQLLDIVGPRSASLAALHGARLEAARAGAREMTAWASLAVADTLGADATREDSGAWSGYARASVPTAAAFNSARYWWIGGDTDFL